MYPEKIIYRNYTFSKHPKQPYYYATVKQKKQCLHRYMYECEVGEIPPGYHVHHVDENPFNNTITNFKLVLGSEHISMHIKKRPREQLLKLQEMGREHAKIWHSSAEGREWHKENYEKNKGFLHQKVKRICAHCSTPTLTTRRDGNAFCSNNCKSAWRRKNKPDKKQAICPVCGIEFTTLKYLPNTYCSRKCIPPPNPRGYLARELPPALYLLFSFIFS